MCQEGMALAGHTFLCSRPQRVRMCHSVFCSFVVPRTLPELLYTAVCLLFACWRADSWDIPVLLMTLYPRKHCLFASYFYSCAWPSHHGRWSTLTWLVTEQTDILYPMMCLLLGEDLESACWKHIDYKEAMDTLKWSRQATNLGTCNLH